MLLPFALPCRALSRSRFFSSRPERPITYTAPAGRPDKFPYHRFIGPNFWELSPFSVFVENLSDQLRLKIRRQGGNQRPAKARLNTCNPFRIRVKRIRRAIWLIQPRTNFTFCRDVRKKLRRVEKKVFVGRQDEFCGIDGGEEARRKGENLVQTWRKVRYINTTPSCMENVYM